MSAVQKSVDQKLRQALRHWDSDASLRHYESDKSSWALRHEAAMSQAERSGIETAILNAYLFEQSWVIQWDSAESKVNTQSQSFGQCEVKAQLLFIGIALSQTDQSVSETALIKAERSVIGTVHVKMSPKYNISACLEENCFNYPVKLLNQSLIYYLPAIDPFSSCG